MVVMSMAQYSKLRLKLDLFKLTVAQAQRAGGDKGRTVSQVMKGLRKRLRESAQTHGPTSADSPGRSSRDCHLHRAERPAAADALASKIEKNVTRSPPSLPRLRDFTLVISDPLFCFFLPADFLSSLSTTKLWS